MLVLLGPSRRRSVSACGQRHHPGDVAVDPSVAEFARKVAPVGLVQAEVIDAGTQQELAG